MLCWAWLLTHVPLFVTQWTVAHQAPLSMRILQARILEWVSLPCSRGCSQRRDQIQVSWFADEFFTVWATREAMCGLIHEVSLLWTAKFWSFFSAFSHKIPNSDYTIPSLLLPLLFLSSPLVSINLMYHLR